MRLRDDLAVLDKKTAPRDDSAIIKVIIPDNFEFGFVTPAGLGIKSFLGLNVRMQFFLFVFQPHCQISEPSRLPEKIEVISHSFALVQLGNCAKEPVLPFETNRRVLHRRRLARWLRSS